MLELHNIICQFKPKELRLLKQFYSGRRDQQKYKLLNLLLEKNITSNKEAAKQIYNKHPDSALSQLKKRLKEDLIQFMCMFCQDQYNDPEVRCENLILQSNTLFMKGLLPESREALVKANKLAEKYDLFIQKILVWEKLTSIKFSGSGLTQQRDGLDQSFNDLLNYVGVKNVSQIVLEPNTHKEPEDFNTRYFKLKESLEFSGSVRIRMWFLLASLEFFKRSHNLIELNHILENLTSLMNSNSLSPLDLASGYQKCALVCLHLNQLDKAKHFAECSVKQLEVIHAFDVEVFETLFLIYFRKHKIKKARKVFMLVQGNLLTNTSNFFKWNYFYACLEFKEGQYKNSIKRLNSITFRKNQLELKVCHRILEILNIIELNDMSRLDFKLENLRKLLERINGPATSRFNIVYYILKKLWDHSFNYSFIINHENEHILNLKDYQLEAARYELVKVEDWLMRKHKMP